MGNRVTMDGYVQGQPETRYVGANQTAITKFKIRVPRPKRKDGEKAPSDFFRVESWGSAAGQLADRDPVMVSGRLEEQSWDDKTTGEKKYATVIVADTVARVLQNRTDETRAAAAAPPRADAPAAKMAEDTFQFDDDDVPF